MKKPDKRNKLTIRRETVALLNSAQLARFVGGDLKTVHSNSEMCDTSESGSGTTPTDECVTANAGCPSMASVCC
jgi:hypothetical protein